MSILSRLSEGMDTAGLGSATQYGDGNFGGDDADFDALLKQSRDYADELDMPEGTRGAAEQGNGEKADRAAGESAEGGKQGGERRKRKKSKVKAKGKGKEKASQGGFGAAKGAGATAVEKWRQRRNLDRVGYPSIENQR